MRGAPPTSPPAARRAARSGLRCLRLRAPSGFHRATWGAVVLLGALLAALPLRSVAEEPRQTARRLLEEAPDRPAAARAAWILERARLLPDARVAYALLEEMPARAPEELEIQARLWRVRYWVAADSLERAAAELHGLDDGERGAAWSEEARCWREILGLQEDGDARERAAAQGRSDWDARRRLAALAGGRGPAPGLREALALEGEARRAGLLGPWIWQLQQSEDPALRRAGRDAARAALPALAHAPEAAEWIALVAAVAGGAEEDREAGDMGITPTPGGVDTLSAPASAPDRGDGVSEGTSGLAAARGAQAPSMATGGAAADRSGAAGASGPRYAAEVRLLDDEGSARALAAELARKGFPAGVTPLAPGGPFRVFLGPCAGPEEAASMGAALERRLLLPYRIVEVP